MRVLPRSLRWRLAPAVLLIHLTVFGGLIALAQRTIATFAEEQGARRARTLKVELEAALAGPIIERDYVTLKEIVSELVSLAEVAYLIVEDAEGRELARAGDPTAHDGDSSSVRSFALGIGAAQVRVGLDAASAVQIWREFGRLSTLWAVLAALAATGLVTLAAMGLTRRLERLAVVADALARGDLRARAPARPGGDELDRLGHAFNVMAREIGERIASLEAARQETTQALQAVHEERARMVALIEAMGTGVLFVDRSDRVLYLN